jgi:ribosome-binding factor A
MESTRQQKIARLIQKDLGEIFQQESRNYFGGVMITVTKVQVAKDLSVAKSYLSIFPSNGKEKIMEVIVKHTKDIRRILGQREHNQLRIIPELQFFLDDSLDYIENIDNLLKQ